MPVRPGQSCNRGPLFLAVSDQGGPVNVTGTSAKLEEEERGENVVEPGKGQLAEATGFTSQQFVEDDTRAVGVGRRPEPLSPET